MIVYRCIVFSREFLTKVVNNESRINALAHSPHSVFLFVTFSTLLMMCTNVCHANRLPFWQLPLYYHIDADDYIEWCTIIKTSLFTVLIMCFWVFPRSKIDIESDCHNNGRFKKNSFYSVSETLFQSTRFFSTNPFHSVRSIRLEVKNCMQVHSNANMQNELVEMCLRCDAFMYV